MSTVHAPLGIGIIGYGGFGQFLHRSWSAMEGIEVRAIADANGELRAAAEANAFGFAQTNVRGPAHASARGPAETNAVKTAGARSDRRESKGGITFYSNWLELLRDADVHIVSIATPPSIHADMACAAMRAGKHVLIEKPVATTRGDALRIGSVAEETGQIAAVDYMLRFNPIIEVLHEWARDGSFGALRRIVVENYAQDESLPGRHWFWDREQSGGILVEHAVHFIDVVNGCTKADPVSVKGVALERADGRVDRMGLTAVYADGLVAQQYHAFSRPGFFEDTGMRFVFDLAQVDIEGWIPLCGRLDALVNGDTIGALNRMPGLEIRYRIPLARVLDASRPEGWGGASKSGADITADAEGAAAVGRQEPSRDLIRSGGVSYHVTEQIRGEFTLPVPKSAAYAEALRLMMEDVAAAVRDPNHRLRAGLAEGLRSLDIAMAATEHAHRR